MTHLSFLSVSELAQITRRKKASAMCRRLKEMRIPHIPDGDGWPLVLRSAIEPLLTGVALHRQADPKPQAEPDFEAAFGKRIHT